MQHIRVIPLLALLLLASACSFAPRATVPEPRQPGQQTGQPAGQPASQQDKPRGQWRATVSSVSDGDTFRVKNPDGGKNLAIRVWGIDAPENKGRQWEKQPYSKESGDLARSLMPVGKPVKLVTRHKDRYKRTVAVVYLEDGSTLQEELLRAGLAWVYPEYCKNCDDWKKLEGQAKKKKKGLWRDPDAVPPWEWRKAGRQAAKEARQKRE